MTTLKKSLLTLGSALAVGVLVAAAPLPALAQVANPCAPKAQTANPCAPKAQSNGTSKSNAATKAANPCAPKVGNPCAPKK